MLKEIKKTLSNIGLIALILGSLFAVCYIPAMNMTAAHQPTQSAHFAKTDQCCQTQNNHHTLTAVSIPAGPVNFEGLLMLLGLTLLFLIGADHALLSKNFINAKLLHARRFLLRLFDYLIQFFSKGVLHPKLYSA